jgi:hypothetical protein
VGCVSSPVTAAPQVAGGATAVAQRRAAAADAARKVKELEEEAEEIAVRQGGGCALPAGCHVNDELAAYLSTKIYMCARTADTAKGLMRMAYAWCKDKKIPSELLVHEICAKAVLEVMKPTPSEEQMGKLYTRRWFQKRVDIHNHRVDGQTVEKKKSLWWRLTSCVRAKPDWSLRAGK